METEIVILLIWNIALTIATCILALRKENK